MKKVYESREAIAFRHPKPSYENHLIISPKKPIRNLRELAMPENGEYLVEIRRAVESVREKYPEFGGEFTLVANGGKRQEVRQVHVHMFTGRKVVEECGEPAPAFYADEFIRIFEHPEPCQ